MIAPQNFQGKKIYTRLNLRNANATAQEIGYKQLSAICHAVGVLQVADSAQLHNIPFKVKVKLRPAEGQYEASNEVTAYKNINEQVGAPAVAGFPAATAPMPPSFAAPAAPMPPAAAPAPAPAAPQWQQPQAPQPWQQPQAPAPAAPQMLAQQPAPAQAPAWNQQAPMQQPMQPQAPVQQAPNPAVAQAQGAVPPWMQGAPAAPAA